MNQFYFDYAGTVSSPYDYNPLQVQGHIHVYLDESKTQHLTDLLFPTFPFSEIPSDMRTAEGFQAYVDAKVTELLDRPETVAKLEEVKTAYDMGLLQLM
jgi:hypothetical protein